MDIRDLKEGARKVDVAGQIVSVGDTRKVNTKDGERSVADCTLKDATGEIGMSLWGDQIDQVVEGSYVKVTNGWVTTYQGKTQLSVGKYGKLEVTGEAPEDAPPPKACPSCGFQTTVEKYRFCPVDGEALG